MAESDETRTPNPNGKNGKPLKIELPFEDVVRAALETPPPPVKGKRRKATKK